MSYALLLHGLNNGPAVMEPIAVELERRGFAVSRGALTGHFENENRLALFRRVTADAWMRDARDWYARRPGGVFVGYSLGALLGLLLQQEGTARFERCVLFAPALALRRWSYLPALLRPLNVVVPSAMPAELRANRGTPTRAYGALFDLVARFDWNAPPPPTTVIVSPGDEMVDYARVLAWTRAHGANLTETNGVRGRRHLVVDPALIPSSLTT